ncbi:MAG: L-histidine N(alpha)-methyltransferase [Chloroflexi bacterium]|nr:L-histidine N(alpha)-methyltransferase [Chloroflexota bacterium]
MSQSDQDFAFGTFADLDFYKIINSRLLDIAEISEQRQIVDLGCGDGGVTKLILDRLQAARQSCIYAIDHSAAAIKEAVANIGDRKEAAVKFIQGDAANLREKLTTNVDAVVYCNSIHYVPDKEKLLNQIKGALKPGGILAFNSSFYEGGQPEESLDFYRKWMMKSIRILRREYGMMPRREDKVESRKQLTPDDYKDLVEAQGFKVKLTEIMKVQVPLAGWVEISGFRDFIEGTLPGVPLKEASAALQKGAKLTYEDMGIQFVNRNWMSVVAHRTS